MSNPHHLNGRAETEDTVIVASAFVVVALAIGGLIYAYSSPEKQIQAASNQPSLIEVVPSQPSQ